VSAPPPSPERIVVWLLIIILFIVFLALVFSVLDVHT
jgi:hypothetical protein